MELKKFFQLRPRSKADIPAYQIHEYDPCRVVWMCIGRQLGFLNQNSIQQRMYIERLHLLPDTEIPEIIKKNISNQVICNEILSHFGVLPRFRIFKRALQFNWVSTVGVGVSIIKSILLKINFKILKINNFSS